MFHIIRSYYYSFFITTPLVNEKTSKRINCFGCNDTSGAKKIRLKRYKLINVVMNTFDFLQIHCCFHN